MIKVFIKKVCSVGLALALIGSLSMSVFAFPNNTFDEYPLIELGKQMILDYVDQREAGHYNVESVDFEIYEKELSSEYFSFNVVATIMHTLKEKSAEELPYIQGMLSALKENQEYTVPLSTFGQEDIFARQIKEVEAYIGEATEINFYFNVSININGSNGITEKDIQLYALDSSDNKVDVSEYNLPSHEEMFNQGYISTKSLVRAIQKMEKDTSITRVGATPISNYDDYDRMAAQEYAYTWWGPSDSDYNPDYSNWNGDGGDCANFVSQCIKAGGVPTDSTWYKDSSAWISTSRLAKYMVDNGYATKESYRDTNAGNFATKPGHSVLVTLNNTKDICFTAHNTNRKDAPFSETELSSTYTFYVIKNY